MDLDQWALSPRENVGERHCARPHELLFAACREFGVRSQHGVRLERLEHDPLESRSERGGSSAQPKFETLHDKPVGKNRYMYQT